MNKIKIKIVVDSLLIISLVLVSISAFSGRSWREVHEISGKAMIVLAIVHIALNWKMFISMFQNLFKSKQSNGEELKTN